MLLRRIAHALRPDVEPARPVHPEVLCRRDLPGAPDAFALIEPLVIDIVFRDVAFCPVTAAIRHIIAAADHELANPVAALPCQRALGEGEVQLHPMPAGHRLLQEKTCPGTAGE